jgi:2-keto-4-pentenoate hydratase/2-oxohepta-3-ene-1,7-dioic acid hydratase in catechol pathway
VSVLRVGSIGGRLSVLAGDHFLDVATASDGRFGPDPISAYQQWDAFLSWADDVVIPREDSARFRPEELDAPVDRPSQVFAIGLNYAEHAAESRMALPEHPVVFTKFASSLTGADVEVKLTGDRVDWEAELVVVIGAGGRGIPREEAWERVAGLAVGQDLSDRAVQTRGNPAQFSLGKSFQGFAPVGPVLPVGSLPQGSDRDALRITCVLTDVDGSTRTLQDGTTADMVFSIPELVQRLSDVVELRPGDLIFTGTPSGVGIGRDPQEFLAPGQVLTTEIEGLGRIRQRMM